MKIALAAVIFAFMFVLAVPAAQAGRAEFCAGFEEGYRAIKGKLAFLPFCPFQPFTPFGSMDFREGIKAGIAKANKG